MVQLICQGFGGIQFNTALKLVKTLFALPLSFGGIQFNTALKLPAATFGRVPGFGGIQFNTALKRELYHASE